MQHQWEASTTRRLQQNRAACRLTELTATEEAKLEARRQRYAPAFSIAIATNSTLAAAARLKTMLADEERLLLAEAAATVETSLDRQAKMRDRIKTLRETRESERQQVV